MKNLESLSKSLFTKPGKLKQKASKEDLEKAKHILIENDANKKAVSKNKKRYLTKSRMKVALECPTKLFYYDKGKIYANTMKEDEFLMALAEGGFQVGELAKIYYEGGHDIQELGYEKSLAQTNELLKQDNVIIYEPAIEYENFFIRIDILKKTGNDVELLEVKSKSVDPSDPGIINKSGFMVPGWRPYFYDVAFQYWVLKQAHPEWNITPYLYLCDKTALSSKDGLNQLFKIKSNGGRKYVKVAERVTKDQLGRELLVKIPAQSHIQMIMNGFEIDPLKKNKEDFKDFIERARDYSKYYDEDKKYPVSIGNKCKYCEYKFDKNNPDLLSGYSECWKEIDKDFDESQPHIFDIWNFRKSEELLKSRQYYLEDIYSDGDYFSMLNERQQLQVSKTVNTDKSEWIDPQLFNEIESWIFPLHFIDFETSMTAIPFHKGRHPYEQIAFQFSCHTLHEDGRIEHNEWIESQPGKFPNYDFVRHLKNVLDKDNGSIFRYAPHENTILRHIQEQMVSKSEDDFGDLIQWIDTVTEWKDSETKKRFYGKRNMIDMWALVKKYYYNPLMRGSNSLKAVLPSIMATSKELKKIYSKPLEYGTNLSGEILWKLDSDTNVPKDPYKLLPNKFDDLDLTKDKMILEDGEISDGAAAMIAFAKMQFTDMNELERQALVQSLLQYCELDTLAMIMLYQHWRSL